MATLKHISGKLAKVNSIIRYVTQEQKTKDKLISGFNCNVETVVNEMNATKKMWNKKGGRQYIHFVQSFAPGENITAQQAHELAMEFVDKNTIFSGYEILVATHQDKEHIHTHFIINSVNYMNGSKYRHSKRDLQKMKDLSDSICKSRGFSICEKGKTFEEKEREAPSVYCKTTYTYNLLKEADDEISRLQKIGVDLKTDSWIMNIAIAIQTLRQVARNKAEFISLLAEKSIGVRWDEGRKYLTFSDMDRVSKGETKCKIRDNKLNKMFNIGVGKESLENGFKANRERISDSEWAGRELAEAAERSNKAASYQGRDYHCSAGTAGEDADEYKKSRIRDSGDENLRTQIELRERESIRISQKRTESKIREQFVKRKEQEPVNRKYGAEEPDQEFKRRFEEYYSIINGHSR